MSDEQFMVHVEWDHGDREMTREDHRKEHADGADHFHWWMP